MSNAFCTKCGAGLAPGSAFCASCGAQAEAAPQTQPAYNASPQAGAAYLKPRGRLSKGAIIGIIGAAAVVITGVILLIVLLGGGGDASVKTADIYGEWSGSIKIENVNTAVPGLSDYGDPEMMKEQVGTEQNITLYIEGSDESDEITVSGNMFYNTDSVYKNGRLTIDMDQGDYVKLKMEGDVSRKDDTYAFKGTWKMTFKGEVFATGSWAAIAIPTFAGSIERTNNTVNQANGSQIATAYNSYNALNPNHPLPDKGIAPCDSVTNLETAIGTSLWPRGLTAEQAAAAWPWVTITDGVAGVLPIDTPPSAT